MVLGVVKVVNVDIVIVILGIVGFGGGILDKFVGLVWFCIYFVGKNYLSE